MGDNTEILKLIRLMHDSPKYWILSSQTVMVGSDKDGTHIFSPEENCFKNKIVITIPEKYPNSIYEWVAMRCYDGYHRWEHTATYDNTLDLSDLAREYDELKSTSFQEEAKKALEDENPVLEFKDHVKHDPITKSDIVRLFIKMRPQLEKYICHIETGNEDPWVIIQHFPKLDNYDKFLYQDEFGNIIMMDYDEQLGYHLFNLFNLKDCDTLIEEERKKIFEFQKENAWEWTANTTGWNNASAFIGGHWNEGSDAGQFKLNSNDQVPIFRTTFTANIGHDKEDIDNILKESTTSAVEPNSISQRLKYMKMKEKRYGNSVTQNITVNGDNNTVIGISMTQTSKDDCEQTQTVVIKNSKSEKKKEKRETVLGTLHQALINLAKIIETYTKYLLDHCFDFFD